MPTPLRATRRSAVYRDAMRAALVGLGLNATLAGVKSVAGVASGSFALLADAVNSAGDVLTSLVVVFGLRIAQRPPDAEHPYGHSRAESIAASNVALIVVLSAAFIVREALARWSQPHAALPAWALAVAAGNVLVKDSVYRYKRAVGRRTGSTALLAAAWDHRADALCSLAVLAGLAVVAVGGDPWRFADELAAIVVALGIAWSGLHLFRQAAGAALDAQADTRMRQQAREVAVAVPGVVAVEALRIRVSGLEMFADIHVEVDPMLSVAEGHRLGHDVKDALLDAFPMLRDVLVHIEPHRGASAPLRP